MKKTVIAVYSKISGNVSKTVEKAFYKAVFLQQSNYIEGAIYGIVFDLPDAPCYRSYGDGEIEEKVRRCYGALPIRYAERLFVTVRARRYNVKTGRKSSFSCENGALGAIRSLLEGGIDGVLTLGSLPRDYEFLYFSGEDGVIECGGINALIDISKREKTNVFPTVKNVEYDDLIVKTRKKEVFSVFEGLYRKEEKKEENIYAESVSRKTPFTGGQICKKEKLTKNNILRFKNETLINDVFVLNIPKYFMNYDNGITFGLKKGRACFEYRSALAASRVFFRIIEKGCVDITDPEEAATVLCALIGMRMLGFLGESELLKNSEVLFEILEEGLALEITKKRAAKVIFLLTVLCGAYSKFAFVSSSFWALKLYAKRLCERIICRISAKSDINNDIYLIICCNKACVDIRKSVAVPKLLRTVMSEVACEDLGGNRGVFGDTESALCVLVSSVNACCVDNFKTFLFEAPGVKAKISYLVRMIDEGARKSPLVTRLRKGGCTTDAPIYVNGEDQADNVCIISKRKKARLGFCEQKGLSPVWERFFQSGIETRLIPYAAYLESIVDRVPCGNDNIVKICFLSEGNSLILCNLLKCVILFPNVFVSVIFDNLNALNKANDFVFRNVQFVLNEETERCEAVKRDSVFFRRIGADTTLSELTGEMDVVYRYKANVKSLPSIFSHRLLGGGTLKNGFCTYLPSGERITYGEFIRNPFTEVESVSVSFVPKLRAKLLKVTFKEEKYRNGTSFSVMLHNGDIVECSREAVLCNGEKITALRFDTGDGLLFAVQIFKNPKEKAYLTERIAENNFFQYCQRLINSENDIERRHTEIIYSFLEKDFSDKKVLCEKNEDLAVPPMTVCGKVLPYSFFGKLIRLVGVGALKGERLALAAKKYAEAFSDKSVFFIRLPARYTVEDDECEGIDLTETEKRHFDNAKEGVRVKTEERANDRLLSRGVNVKRRGVKGKQYPGIENEYRYPFYIHCLDRIKKNKRNADAAFFHGGLCDGLTDNRCSDEENNI